MAGVIFPGNLIEVLVILEVCVPVARLVVGIWVGTLPPTTTTGTLTLSGSHNQPTEYKSQPDTPGPQYCGPEPKSTSGMIQPLFITGS